MKRACTAFSPKKQSGSTIQAFYKKKTSVYNTMDDGFLIIEKDHFLKPIT